MGWLAWGDYIGRLGYYFYFVFKPTDAENRKHPSHTVTVTGTTVTVEVAATVTLSVLLGATVAATVTRCRYGRHTHAPVYNGSLRCRGCNEDQ